MKSIQKGVLFLKKIGYKEWPCLKEIAEFAIKAGFGTVGIAFCIGLKNETKIAADYYKDLN